MKSSIIIGINASRARSGGAKAHMIGILSDINKEDSNIKEIHIWSYPELLNLIPDQKGIIKHTSKNHSKSIIKQLYWEKFNLPKELHFNNCNILLNVDAGSVCRFHPNVSMSRDMLSYEKGEMRRYGFSRERLRLLVLKFVQNSTLRQADGVIFLTEYAASQIQKSTGPLRKIKIIPHGISEKFHKIKIKNKINKNKNHFNCVYVSNYAPYKHQWNCIKAITNLRSKGYSIDLMLIGGGFGESKQKVTKEIQICDPKHMFIHEIDVVPNTLLPKYLTEADIFLFASSCENMPNTLLEGMAAGLPIACSNRGPMPEVLKNGGIYFDPEKIDEITCILEELITDEVRRLELGSRSKLLSSFYTWESTSLETFSYLKHIYIQDVISKSSNK